jgi:sugar phosphate isomerase/epimerase
MHLQTFLYVRYVLATTMSTTRSAATRRTIERCQPENATPVTIHADALDSTARDHLRELKRELDAEDLVPARLAVDACFDADCSFATQDEVERVREYVRAASFLGASTVTVSFDGVADEAKVRPALEACAERARREGVTLELDGPLSLS